MSVKLRAEIWASQIQGNHNEAISRQNPFNKDFDRELYQYLFNRSSGSYCQYHIEHIYWTLYGPYSMTHTIWSILYGYHLDFN